MTRILLLIPTASYRATDFMEAASRMGLEIVVGSDEGQILADLFPGRSLTASFAHPAEGAQEIAKFADSYPLDSIVALDDAGTVLAARAADLLRLPHNAVDGVEATRNKALLRQRLSERGLPSPEFHVCSLDDDVAAVARSVRYPCVIKPLSLSGSRGVMRADDAVSFAEAVGRLRGILERPEVAEECGPNAREYLVEGYIPGDEVALEGLLTSGALHVLALFDKPDPLVGPFFEETIYVTPSGLPQARQREIARTAAQAASALGIVDGPIHAEFRLNSEGCWPIDIAARSIGGLCSRTLTFAGGVSLEEIILRHAAGAPIETLEREAQASGVMMISIPASGKLAAVRGLDEARAVAGVTDIRMTVQVGHFLTPLPEGGEYLGFIFAEGETAEAVEASLREAHATLHFEIDRHAAVPSTGGDEAPR